MRRDDTTGMVHRCLKTGYKKRHASIDFYLQHLVKNNAQAIQLASNQVATFVFPTGPREEQLASARAARSAAGGRAP
ncbi:MAG: hypothetical protein R3A78_10745 [Polyangiales bacterium]